MEVDGQCQALTTVPPEKDPAPIAYEAGWAPGSVWVGAENLACTGIRFPDHPALSESLCRLHYPGNVKMCVCNSVNTLVYGA